MSLHQNPLSADPDRAQVNLPNSMGDTAPSVPSKQVPDGVTQHANAGPYSPVLIVRADRLVVISGQVAITEDGATIGETIEEQARATLENCAQQLATAGCTLRDVFKVNVYLADASLWEPFNTVYREVMPEPLPVRTAVAVSLVGDFLVELEMWAAQP